MLEFTIHGLGAAMNRAVELALTLRDEFKGTISISCNTSTVKLIDDFEPLVDVSATCVSSFLILQQGSSSNFKRTIQLCNSHQSFQNTETVITVNETQ